MGLPFLSFLPPCFGRPAARMSKPEVSNLAAITSPATRIIKRSNGGWAHLLELPSTVPYAVRFDGKDAIQETVHVVPCFSPETAALIRSEAMAAAKRHGGWQPRAVGCCTNDILCNQVRVTEQRPAL